MYQGNSQNLLHAFVCFLLGIIPSVKDLGMNKIRFLVSHKLMIDEFLPWELWEYMEEIFRQAWIELEDWLWNEIFFFYKFGL